MIRYHQILPDNLSTIESEEAQLRSNKNKINRGIIYPSTNVLAFPKVQWEATEKKERQAKSPSNNYRLMRTSTNKEGSIRSPKISNNTIRRRLFWNMWVDNFSRAIAKEIVTRDDFF